MSLQLSRHRRAFRAGLIGAGIHTFIVLAVFLKVLTLSDGTAKWGVSMGLLWTLEIWLAPLYWLFGWNWDVQSFYMLSILGGGLFYFVMTYLGARIVLKLKTISH